MAPPFYYFRLGLGANVAVCSDRLFCFVSLPTTPCLVILPPGVGSFSYRPA